jgi:biotin transport system substrate-specific component
MWPVPMTMQSFVVLFLGATLGPRLGVAAVALYLAQGAMGLPVFANTPPAVASLAYFMGPTGGFLVGFLPAAWLAGRAARPGVPLWRVGAGLLGAHAVLLLAGLVWLAVFAQLASGAVGVGFERAFVSGVQPFLLGTLVKVALATALVGAGWSLARRRG